jgi:hypothetical protein
MDQICELVSRITHSPQVFIYLRSKASKKLNVVGSYGFLETEISENWHLAALDNPACNAISIANTDQSEELVGHPMLRTVPKVRSLLAFRIQQAAANRNAVLMVLNPAASVFADHDLMTALLLLVRLVGTDFDWHVGNPGISVEAVPGNAFAENGTTQKFEPDQTSAAFLLKTLLVKHRLLARNGVSYIGIRSWRATIKPYQIAALTALKAEIPKSFVTLIAEELAKAAVSHFGAKFISNVVPIPCGSSGKSDCLSVQIAAELARLLNCNFKNVLKTNVPKGASHPKSSAKLHSMELVGTLEGTTLVIDDVITSGKHVVLALKTLRERNINSFAMGWIVN